jgi:hypothetical protein
MNLHTELYFMPSAFLLQPQTSILIITFNLDKLYYTRKTGRW